MSKETIGFLGLGAMGKPMALNLVKAGHPVITTFHRNRAPADELAAAGAELASDAVGVAARAEVLITMLPADAEIIEVYDAALPALGKGSLCIDMTSAKPDTMIAVSEKAAAAGIAIVDAPVSGGIAKAVDGTLTIMTGGTAAAVARARPILQVMGSAIFETGDVGSGKAFKMINQLLNAGNTMIASEALFLARRLELDLEKLVDVVGKSSGGSWIFANKVPKFMIPRAFDTGFKLELMSKDVGLTADYARSQDLDLPAATLLNEVFRTMMNEGQEKKDYTVISRYVEEKNGEGG
jgi:3-hydroxyisobutyrate dehydrogenase-like beta-hydroxyacid dehydrogenase